MVVIRHTSLGRRLLKHDSGQGVALLVFDLDCGFRILKRVILIDQLHRLVLPLLRLLAQLGAIQERSPTTTM